MFHSMAQRLVAELRSGYHKQGREALHNSETDAKCCLGVACWMVHQEARVNCYNDVANQYLWAYEGAAVALDLTTLERFGFYSDLGNRRDGNHLHINDKSYESLAEANDSGRTFAQIADYIEANWEAL